MKRLFSIALIFLFLLTILPAISVYAEEREEYCVNLEFTDVNGERTAASLIVYTPEHGKTTSTSGNGIEIAVNSDGIVTEVEKNNLAIPEGGLVISAGVAKKNDLPPVQVGDYVFFNKEYTTVTLISLGYEPFGSTMLEYDAINATRAENKLIIYRGKAASGTNTWGYEAVVDANGVIVSVGGNNNTIPEDGFVISGVGTKKQLIEDACKLGYNAVIDEDGKTITVSYVKENALNCFDLRLNELLSSYKRAIDTFADVDHDSASASNKKLSLIYREMESALTADNIYAFLNLTYNFESEADLQTDALIPYIPVETRALWLRIPATSAEGTVEKVVKEIYDMGFNSVCIELLFDSTTIMPMPEDSLFEQNPAFNGEDMLKLYIDEFHNYGIEVHAWMSCFRVGHDGSSNVNLSVGKKKPEWLNLDQNGNIVVKNEYGSAFFLNPALPEVREFLLSSYKYILENYAIDGFQLDYIRYPENSTVNYGYDEYTKSEFLKKYGFSAVPTTSNQTGWAEWCEFRASYVTEFVISVRSLIDAVRPDVLFSCDVAPDYASSLTKMCQDTEKWLKEGIVDVVYPMAYGTTDAVGKWTVSTVELSGNSIQTVIGLRDNGPEIYREQIMRARECNADGTAFFSYTQYTAGDYNGYIKNTVFAENALCPSYDAKEAILSQIAHFKETVDIRMPMALENVPEDVKAYANTLVELSARLDQSDVKTLINDINNVIVSGKAIVESYAASEAISDKNIAVYISTVVRILEKTANNSKDSEKVKYLERYSVNDEISGDESSVDDSAHQSGLNVFEKIFQVIFIIIMSIGLFGLPAFYWLNARKKRFASEFAAEENLNDDGSADEIEISEHDSGQGNE